MYGHHLQTGKQMDVNFDARGFLQENFHDAPGVIAYLRAKGVDALPSEAAVAKWLQRSSMPGEWLAVIAGHLEGDRGGAGQLAKFVSGARSAMVLERLSGVPPGR